MKKSSLLILLSCIRLPASDSPVLIICGAFSILFIIIACIKWSKDKKSENSIYSQLIDAQMQCTKLRTELEYVEKEKQDIAFEYAELKQKYDTLQYKYKEQISKSQSELKPPISIQTSKCMPQPDPIPSTIEYFRKLPHVIEAQTTLDKYNSRKKTDYDIGLEYERFIGYRYENQGCTVEYNGSHNMYRDMGCDLCVHSGDEMIIVQCKRWKQGKQIRENCILQLHGTVALFQEQHKNKHVVGLLITTASVSSEAKKCAAQLGIKIREHYKYEPYPLIKCVNLRNQKNYYLPSDLYYDDIKLRQSCRVVYVSSVAEAEFLGYRHYWQTENYSKTTNLKEE